MAKQQSAFPLTVSHALATLRDLEAVAGPALTEEQFTSLVISDNPAGQALPLLAEHGLIAPTPRGAIEGYKLTPYGRREARRLPRSFDNASLYFVNQVRAKHAPLPQDLFRFGLPTASEMVIIALHNAVVPKAERPLVEAGNAALHESLHDELHALIDRGLVKRVIPSPKTNFYPYLTQFAITEDGHRKFSQVLKAVDDDNLSAEEPRAADRQLDVWRRFRIEQLQIGPVPDRPRVYNGQHTYLLGIRHCMVLKALNTYGAKTTTELVGLLGDKRQHYFLATAELLSVGLICEQLNPAARIRKISLYATTHAGDAVAHQLPSDAGADQTPSKELCKVLPSLSQSISATSE